MRNGEDFGMSARDLDGEAYDTWCERNPCTPALLASLRAALGVPVAPAAPLTDAQIARLQRTADIRAGLT